VQNEHCDHDHPDGNQRWRGRTDRFVGTRHRFDPSRYDVAELAGDGSDATARAFVEAHHYSGSYPAARFRYGLYGPDGLEGVAVFSHPARDAVLANALPGLAHRLAGVELGRFVLLDSVGFNGETWFLARALGCLRRAGIQGVVSFSDPVPRQRADGRVVHAGHLGVIYQAASAVYRERGTPRTLRLLPDARVLSERAISKLRRRAGVCASCAGCPRCKGWRYAAGELVAHGAEPPPAEPGLLSAWVAFWLGRLTRPLRHPGCHRYVFALARAVRRLLLALPAVAYPRCA
jgi:hypothetical protein